MATDTAMSMKSSAAFALGLWVGAVVVAAIGAFHLRGLALARREPTPQMAKELQGKTEEIQLLRQEQARLTAEGARLRQTISELKSNLDARVLMETRRDLREARRRVPFSSGGETSSSTPSSRGADESWIAAAVANGDVSALPRLQSAALEGSEGALDALALLADRDSADALTRVWRSESLTTAQRMRATRLLAATVEVNPRGARLLQALFTAQDIDPKLLARAIDGLVNPNFVTTLGIPSPPPYRPDYAERLRLVDSLRAQVTDTNVLASLDNAREELAALAGQAELPAQ